MHDVGSNPTPSTKYMGKSDGTGYHQAHGNSNHRESGGSKVATRQEDERA